MTRIPLSDLRAAFANPTNYVKSFRPGKNGRGGPSKYGMFLFSIGEYHKTGDLGKAEEYLEEKIEKNFKNFKDLPEYIRKLQDYAREFRRTENTFVKVRDNVILPTPPKYSDYVVSGQAARIDLLEKGGYGVWLFVRNVADWDRDPRLPLLQGAYADKFGVSPDEVTVGVYDFELTLHSSRQYSEQAIHLANKRLSSLLRLLKATLKPVP